MQFVWFIFIGLAAGWLAGQLTKGKSSGLLGDLAVGVLGAVIGGVLFSLLGLSASNLVGRLVTATVGAVILIAAVRTLKRS